MLFLDAKVLVLKIGRKKEVSCHPQCTRGQKWRRRCGKVEVFLASRKKINLRIEFKTKFENTCSLAWRDTPDLLIPTLDVNSFLALFFKK